MCSRLLRRTPFSLPGSFLLPFGSLMLPPAPLYSPAKAASSLPLTKAEYADLEIGDKL